MNCKKCQMKILYPQRPYAVVEDDVYCSETCFFSVFKVKQEKKRKLESDDLFEEWKGEGHCSYCNSECNPASQTCETWPRCY